MYQTCARCLRIKAKNCSVILAKTVAATASNKIFAADSDPSCGSNPAIAPISAMTLDNSPRATNAAPARTRPRQSTPGVCHRRCFRSYSVVWEKSPITSPKELSARKIRYQKDLVSSISEILCFFERLSANILFSLVTALFCCLVKTGIKSL